MTIRRLPQDFQVDERLAPEWLAALEAARSERTPVAVYRLTKEGLTTPDAVAHLCRSLRVSPGAASYAGLKDRHALTAQHVSIRAASALPGTCDGRGWRARLVGWCAVDLTAGAIAGNDFAIVVRGLNARAVAEMERAAAALAIGPDRLRLANYFGDQRFGSARHGRGFAAEALIAGDFDGALRLLVGTPARKDSGRQRTFTRLCAAHWGDWQTLARVLPRCQDRAPFERLAAGAPASDAFQALPRFQQGMCIEAFQSLLWNDTLRRMVETLGVPAHAASDDFGTLLFPQPAHIPSEWEALDIPLLTPDTALEGVWAPHARAALEARGLALERLRVPGMSRPFFGAAGRPALVEAREFALAPPHADDLGGRGAFQRMVRFSLPRGAYATVVLRALGQ